MRPSRRLTLMMAILALILYSTRTARSDEAVIPQDEAVISPDEPVTPPDEPVTPPDEPVTPQDEPVTPQDEPVTPPVEPVPIPDEATSPPHPGVIFSDEEMLILPASRLAPVETAPAPILVEGGLSIPGVDSAEYRRVYKSIPFSRAEYRNNPGYRHDTTMEILTGNARHQTIVQHNHEHKDKEPVQRIPVPARPSRVLTPFAGFGNLWGAPIWNYMRFAW